MQEYIEYFRYALAVLLLAVGSIMLAAGLIVLFLAGQELLVFIDKPESSGLLQLLLAKAQGSGFDITGNLGDANINIVVSAEIKLALFALFNVWIFAVLISIAKSLIEGGISILKSILANVFISSNKANNENMEEQF